MTRWHAFFILLVGYLAVMSCGDEKNYQSADVEMGARSPRIPSAPSVHEPDLSDARDSASSNDAVFTLGSKLVPNPAGERGGRTRVPSVRAREYPYSAVGVLVPTYCTITLIGPHTALSAAHCVWDRGIGILREDGYLAGASIPITAIYFGLSGITCGPAASYVMIDPHPHLAIPPAYMDPRTPNAVNMDFVILDFAPREPGAVVGWYGTHGDHDGPLYLIGYPTKEGLVQLWERGPGAAGEMFGGSLPDVFTHDLDAAPGDSGACLSAWVPVSRGATLGWRVCTGVQMARVSPSGLGLARAWDAAMHRTAQSLGGWP